MNEFGNDQRDGPMKLVAYIRVSTANQQEAYGPDIQRKAIADWAKSGGHKIAAWQTDVISGASELRDRAGWREAAALVKAGQADGIVVARLDRLARDVMVQELLLRKLSELGGIVLSTRENENEMLNGESKDPSRKLVRVIMGAISEYDREMTVDRLAAGRQAKAARGGYAHGALPYGYRSAKGKLVEVPQEQAALQKMRSLAAQGVPTREIARVLTAEGYPTKRGGAWSSPTVSRILNRDNTRKAVSA
ncbi:recombinase family protein [Mycolicibacterium frederiksbergense]|uniref:recombinase family protein n=1 Tax=Mycolicibacterium frederiksbergense TaxID=117567 RepID=UPI00399BBF13